MNCIIDKQAIRAAINPAIDCWASSTVCSSEKTMSGNWLRIFLI